MSVNPISESAAVKSHQAQRKYGVIAAGALAAVFAVGVASFLISYGTEMRNAAEFRRAMEIEDESRTYCGRWGMRETTAAYATCAKDLDDIRAKHERRINADMAVSHGGWSPAQPR
jgi:hypothetical protein